jgi:hypothetical protein
LYNKASAPDPSQDTPVDVVVLSVATAANNPSGVIWSGPAIGSGDYTAGLSYTITGGLADNDQTAVAAGDVLVTLHYR